MGSKRNLVLLALVVAILALVLAPSPAPAIDCDELPWGWWYHPGLFTACHLVEQFWNCGFDLECWGWDDGY